MSASFESSNRIIQLEGFKDGCQQEGLVRRTLIWDTKNLIKSLKWNIRYSNSKIKQTQGQAFDVKNGIVSQKLQKCYLYSSYETS